MPVCVWSLEMRMEFHGSLKFVLIVNDPSKEQQFKHWEGQWQIKIAYMRKLEQIKSGGCVQAFSRKSSSPTAGNYLK